MKRFILTLTAIFICTIAYAHTINWHVGNTILETTTCDSGESITPPTAPYKYGYHFVEWVDYRPIEYLESTGTQWINSIYQASNNFLRLKGRFQYVNFEKGSSDVPFTMLFGSYDGKCSITFGNFNPANTETATFYIEAGSSTGTVYPGISIKKTEIYDFDITASNGLKTGFVGQQDINTSYSGTISSYPVCFFGSKHSGQGAYAFSKARIYRFEIYSSTGKVRDFIPVLDKNGVPCMYDKVEKKFYYNAGTGDFIAGPVISE